MALLLMAATAGSPAFAAYDNWNSMVDDMQTATDEAYSLYLTGEVAAAKAQVDVAYYGFYEKYGFEKTVMAYISGARAAQVEYQFSLIKKAMSAGAPKEEIKAGIALLVKYLREDANQLDGKSESPVGVFFGSLTIIVREGFEAILIVGAIIAYLLKSGNKRNVRAIYWGSLIALGASVVMALVLNLIIGGGQNQEIIEGVTMLIAVVVLFYVSNWMVSKAESGAWSSYIKSKVETSINRGSVFSLAFAAFLAVFREGAETILFYQALLGQTQTYTNMIWLGLGVGAVLLVGVYILIRFVSIKLPLKPFFLGTSILLFAMSISFTGNAIKELQEGNVIGVSPVQGIVSVDILGIYPTLETLIPQLVLLVITAATFIIQMRRGKRVRAAK
jgi:high-affinity iron transporter